MTSALTPLDELRAIDRAYRNAHDQVDRLGGHEAADVRASSLDTSGWDCAAVLAVLTLVQLIWVASVLYVAFWIFNVS